MPITLKKNKQKLYSSHKKDNTKQISIITFFFDF